MQKGRTLSERDMEILQAFLISQADIRRAGLEEPDIEDAVDEQQASTDTRISPLQRQVSIMEGLLKSVFKAVQTGMKLPVLDLRNGLQAMLEHINEYNVLTFSPIAGVGGKDVLIRKSVLSALTSYQLA